MDLEQQAQKGMHLEKLMERHAHVLIELWNRQPNPLLRDQNMDFWQQWILAHPLLLEHWEGIMAYATDHVSVWLADLWDELTPNAQALREHHHLRQSLNMMKGPTPIQKTPVQRTRL